MRGTSEHDEREGIILTRSSLNVSVKGKAF